MLIYKNVLIAQRLHKSYWKHASKYPSNVMPLLPFFGVVSQLSERLFATLGMVVIRRCQNIYSQKWQLLFFYDYLFPISWPFAVSSVWQHQPSIMIIDGAYLHDLWTRHQLPLPTKHFSSIPLLHAYRERERVLFTCAHHCWCCHIPHEQSIWRFYLRSLPHLLCGSTLWLVSHHSLSLPLRFLIHCLFSFHGCSAHLEP